MVTLAQFARKMRKRGKKLDENVNKVIIKMAGSILQTAVIATPVDTGRARGGWVVGLGVPITAAGEQLDVSGAGAISAGKATLAGRRSGQTIYINNNVEYIGKLNDGSSAQAPKNFVADAVRAGIKALDGAKVVD